MVSFSEAQINSASARNKVSELWFIKLVHFATYECQSLKKDTVVTGGLVEALDLT